MRLLGLAGYADAALVELTQLSMEKKRQLLEATTTQYFSYRGRVEDQRTEPDLKIQLDAARLIDEIVGIKAPPARQQVTIVHKVELPAWMLPDGAEPTVIDVDGTTE